jgi:hypothetical protein
MIRPEHQHRFDGDSGVDVASYEIDALFPNGTKVPVMLRIGAPFQRDDQWWVRAELENLDSTDGPIAGEGSLHTIVLAIRWIILRLTAIEKSEGCRYFWKDSEGIFEYRDVLATNKNEN